MKITKFSVKINLMTSSAHFAETSKQTKHFIHKEEEAQYFPFEK